jgi:hypothetical protein
MSQGSCQEQGATQSTAGREFCRMMPRAGMTGPGQRHTGNN